MFNAVKGDFLYIEIPGAGVYLGRLRDCPQACMYNFDRMFTIRQMMTPKGPATALMDMGSSTGEADNYEFNVPANTPSIVTKVTEGSNLYKELVAQCSSIQVPDGPPRKLIL